MRPALGFSVKRVPFMSALRLKIRAGLAVCGRGTLQVSERGVAISGDLYGERFPVLSRQVAGVILGAMHARCPLATVDNPLAPGTSYAHVPRPHSLADPASRRFAIPRTLSLFLVKTPWFLTRACRDRALTSALVAFAIENSRSKRKFAKRISCCLLIP